MAISPGRSIGPYQILGLIGAGGMGQVHKARDTRLNRVVAIKILSETSDSVGGRNRLLREAQAASALNHPNIVTVHDVLTQDGCDMIVMEYVEGTTLADQIGRKRKGLPLDTALRYLLQIADALSAAHAAGIVHRDVKPGNIMVTEAGAAKVLDFGLAQQEPTIGEDGETATVTTPGAIAGTFLYMSPEQAEGKRVDTRSDIFAFGSVAYEMLSGQPAFPGDSRLAIVGAILHRDPPPLRSFRQDVPPELDRLVNRCLRKDPTRRLQSIQDVRILLEELLENPATPPPDPKPPRRMRLAKAGTSALIAALAVAAGALLVNVWLPPSGTDLSSYRLTAFATESGEESAPAWSLDGRTLAYEFVVDGIRQIYTRSLDAASETRVTSSRDDCNRPFWAPDGSSIYYQSQRALWSVSPAGGRPRIVAPNTISAAISPDGKTMVMTRGFVGDAELLIASPVGAEPKLYRAAPFSAKLAQISSPQFAPNGSKFVVSISRHAAVSEPEFWIVPFPSGAPKRVPIHLPGSRNRVQPPSWMPDSRRLMLSVQGHLYSADSESGDLRQITASTVTETQPAVSPDGRRIAFTSGTDDSNIMLMALDGSSSRPLLATSRSETDPAWSPVNSQFAYVTTAGGVPEIWMRNANGSVPTLLVRPEGSDIYDIEKLNFSPDGSRISFDQYGEHHVTAIVNVAGGRPVIPDPQSSDQHGISWSPDGNWIAYRRLNGARWELVKRPVGGGDAVLLEEAAEGGSKTEWSSTGEWICHQVGMALHLVAADGSRHVVIDTRVDTFGFSRDGASLYAIRRNSARRWELAAFAVPGGRPKGIVPLDVPVSATVAGFSASPDGKTFITSVGQSLFDIWFLEGFAPPHRWFFR